MPIKAGVAGVGAIGGTVCKALQAGQIPGMELTAVAEQRGETPFAVPVVDFTELVERCDVIVEALPPDIVPELARIALGRGRTLVMISAAALLRFPEIKTMAEKSEGRLVVPSGALTGIDGVRALASMGLRRALIRSTKKPAGFTGAPFVVANDIDLKGIVKPTRLFAGNALDAAAAFPANVNVAAILSLAGLGPEKTEVEVWADPEAKGNTHEIDIEGVYTSFQTVTVNQPDPANPKTSILAAHSIIAALRQMTEKLSVI